MMEFNGFKQAMTTHLKVMLKDHDTIFQLDIDKDILWELYLDSFPQGTNDIYRERREHDCSGCKQFIRGFGGVVTIEDYQIRSVWDLGLDDETYGPVCKALSEYVHDRIIQDVFYTSEDQFGIGSNREQLPDGSVRTWEHLYIRLPDRFVHNGRKSSADLAGRARDIRNVFKRSLEEITPDALDTVLELIAQNSLHRGLEWQSNLKEFKRLQEAYLALDNGLKGFFCWVESIKAGPVIGKIKNHSIGVLLSNISADMDLNIAVAKYDKIVCGDAYKRPNPVFSEKQRQQAEKVWIELGLEESGGRRHATVDDITINNVLFANKDVKATLAGSVFDELKKETTSKAKLGNFDKVEEINIETFIKDILPGVSSIELLLENALTSNLMSLIAPQAKGAPSMFKWDNGFSWAYNGNIADSMRERVKALGGKVDGDLRFSIQWNEDGNNDDDLDAHCFEPRGGGHIFYPNKGKTHPSSGMLDVDIMQPTQDISNKVAVENIIYSDKRKMPKGIYDLKVHNYQNRRGRGGFRAELEFDGQIFSYDYQGAHSEGRYVPVVSVEHDGKGNFKIVKSMDSTQANKVEWGLGTNEFHPVEVMAYSPNYWDSQSGIGHKHYLFMLKDCVNDSSPNGFFNEFLREEFMEHKKVFEALGSKMRVDPSVDQLSGLGFSSTKRNKVVCKLEGNFKRVVKLVF